MIFRAIWPITDPQAPFLALCTQAYADVARLLLQAHATPTGHGRFTAAPSAHVPGSGRVTDWVLLYECPARRVPVRALPQIPVLATSTPASTGNRPAADPGGEARRQPANQSDQAGDTAA